MKGIHHELTVPHTPEQNGVAERMNRTLMESARSMMSHAGLPDSYWAEAVATAAYITNRTSTTALEKMTPYEQWYGRNPDLSNLRVFGCVAYAHIPENQRQKLDKKADKLRFVGYSIKSKGYRLLDEKTSKVLIGRDVIFNETNFCQLKETGNDLVEVKMSSDDSETCEPERHEYPQQQRHVPIRYGIDEYVNTAVESLGDTLTPLEEALTSDHATE